MIAVVAVLSFLAGLSALMAVMAVIEPDTTAPGDRSGLRTGGRPR